MEAPAFCRRWQTVFDLFVGLIQHWGNTHMVSVWSRYPFGMVSVESRLSFG